YGWIWREVVNANPGEPHWLRTGFSTFDQIEALGERITEKRQINDQRRAGLLVHDRLADLFPVDWLRLRGPYLPRGNCFRFFSRSEFAVRRVSLCRRCSRPWRRRALGSFGGSLR